MATRTTTAAGDLMTMRFADRFWSKVTPTGFCWEWSAYRDPRGYGRFNIGSHTAAMAHRVAYELLVGPVPDGLDLDHLCRNRLCVNPDHLEPVTRAVNAQRGLKGALSAPGLHHLGRRGQCKNGHDFTPENTYRNAKGARVCRACHRDAQARFMRRKEQSVA